jgi:electron transport complex protein RnfE
MKEGLFTNNPIFVQFLGMCSALAITTSVGNAVGMGLSVTAVLVCSNVIISLLRKFIVPQVRIAAFIVVISGFVTVVELAMKAFLPDLNKSLGLFIPLIVVNCIILARAESFASKNGVLASAVDGIWQGLGYTFAVVVTSVVRELLGTGKIAGVTILGEWYQPANIFILPPGAFLTLAFLVAAFNAIIKKVKKSADKKKIEAAKASLMDDADVFPEEKKEDVKGSEDGEKKETADEVKEEGKEEANG